MAKRDTLLKGINTIGHFTRNNLERMGSMLDSVQSKSDKPRQYTSVNLGDDDYQQDLFREQTLKATQQLLGNRFATYSKYAKKVVPDNVFQSTVDGAFSQVAKLASSWSQVDLPTEHRFANIATLDKDQRHELATSIANQNRALATLGGLTGMAGLPGLLADTLWLLLVSLRTVYQLAAVYDKPLTGTQGVKMAYELLANADLSKMQEKQALLAGIGVSKGLIDNAQSGGLHNQLKNLGLKNQNVNFYAEQVDSIASQVGIDLDKINLSWITRFLPATAVIIGMRYNSHLIDEVIGVAQATFAPEAKLAKRSITNDSDKTETKKATDNKDAEAKKATDGAADKTKDDVNKSTASKNEAKKADDNKVGDKKASDNKAGDKKDSQSTQKSESKVDAKAEKSAADKKVEDSKADKTDKKESTNKDSADKNSTNKSTDSKNSTTKETEKKTTDAKEADSKTAAKPSPTSAKKASNDKGPAKTSNVGATKVEADQKK